MRAQVLDDLIRVLELLGRGSCSRVSSNTAPRACACFSGCLRRSLGVSASCCCARCSLHIPPAWNPDICPCKIDGVQKFLDAASVFDLKGAAYLLDGKFQVPDSIPVVLQQLPCIMEQGIFLLARYVLVRSCVWHDVYLLSSFWCQSCIRLSVLLSGIEVWLLSGGLAGKASVQTDRASSRPGRQSAGNT